MSGTPQGASAGLPQQMQPQPMPGQQPQQPQAPMALIRRQPNLGSGSGFAPPPFGGGGFAPPGNLGGGGGGYAPPPGSGVMQPPNQQIPPIDPRLAGRFGGGGAPIISDNFPNQGGGLLPSALRRYARPMPQIIYNIPA